MSWEDESEVQETSRSLLQVVDRHDVLPRQHRPPLANLQATPDACDRQHHREDRDLDQAAHPIHPN